jgi:hypothetical protein
MLDWQSLFQGTTSYRRHCGYFSCRKGGPDGGYPADLHLRLCVINGDVLLRDKLAALLAS